MQDGEVSGSGTTGEELGDSRGWLPALEPREVRNIEGVRLYGLLAAIGQEGGEQVPSAGDVGSFRVLVADTHEVRSGLQLAARSEPAMVSLAFRRLTRPHPG